MKDRLIAAIIADRTRLFTLSISAALALSAWAAAEWFGVELNDEHKWFITTIVTLLLGWALEALGAEKNAVGAGKVQEALKEVNPSVVVDRFIGDQTIGAVKKMADENRE
jgi:hypothetical protein